MNVLLIILLLNSYFYLILSNGCHSLNQNQPYPPQQEIEALVDFFNSTGGNSWTIPYNCGWTNNIHNISYNPCSWYGVSCDSSGLVTSIIFTENANIVGTLPNTICNLTNVQQITISNYKHITIESNTIYGIIPDCWTNTSSIVKFIINGGCITGQYPLTFTSSGTLQNFVVTGLLNSPFPESSSSLAMIEFVIIPCTSKTPYPDLYTTTASLVPKGWSSWMNLETFYLVELSFYIGTIPTYFGTFTNLTSLGIFVVNFD